VAQAQIVNGGFEVPVIASNSAQQFNAGSAAIVGWTVQSGSVDLVDTGLFAAFQGKQSLDLDGLSPGSISQSFATIAGQTYNLDFAYANNGITPFAGYSANVNVTGGGTLLNTTISHNTSGGAGASLAQMDYVLFHGLFVADSAASTILFSSLDPAGQNGGIVLDAVSITPAVAITATPEFGSVFSLGGLLAAGGFGFWARRRRSR